jgi:hypothetical protein
MARYSVETRHKPDQILRKADLFFGEAGLGLETVERGSCCVSYEGGGGYVWVAVVEEGRKTLVDLETREWDYPVQGFMKELG